jgi:transcriptional regulator with XRE-family HTH domain
MTANKEAYKAELTTFLKDFGANVRRVRRSKNPPYSQERLAEATRLHRTEIGKIEQGAVEPRLSTLFILANALEVRIDDLVEGLTPPRERRPPPHTEPW